ncbi:class IV lanthionine synthetase LanL [Dactylosporangium sp. NPDC051541]|uniref:class IV lanthionine synthetase LanL n=1 Tax=Dactylosporangium sp. NPDC051541 TaxID=3363977 RepID=UPI0037ABC6B2
MLLLDVLRATLARCGADRWEVIADEAWCRVNPPAVAPRPHGWKLHVTATPLGAPLVLARAVEVLVAHEARFKFAADIPRVEALVDVWHHRGGAGKFITVYPRDDAHLREVAGELDRALRGLSGPRILSDRPYRPGSLVHYRYGTFDEKPTFTADGRYESRMVGPDGTAVSDERLAWFAPPPWAESPFPADPAAGDPHPASVRLADRYEVRSALRHANKGGVYRARDTSTDAEVVIKQARAFVGARLDGTDVRSVLRDEARMLEALAPLGVAPAKVELFEEQGDLFLVEEFLAGTVLSRWTIARTRLAPDVALALAIRLVELLATVHAGGFAVRDFKPANVMVDPDGGVRLIDVEYLTTIGREHTYIGTQGYAAPEAEAARDRDDPVTATVAADLFGLGATLFCAITGTPPGWVQGRPELARPAVERRRVLTRIAATHPVLAPFIPVIVGLTDEEPGRRWSLERVRAHLGQQIPAPSAGIRTMPALARDDGWPTLVDDALAHVRRGMRARPGSLWEPSAPARETDPGNLWHGAAGGLAVLTRAAAVRDEPWLPAAVREAADWLDARRFDVPRLLPGLAFGRAGTAWALHDAAQQLGDPRLGGRAVELAAALPTTAPSADVTHGLAGAGLLHVALYQRTGRPELAERVRHYADTILGAARRRGPDWAWPVRSDADSRFAGRAALGFAHGVAGIGAFLLAAATTLGEDRYRAAAVGAGDTLARAAQVEDGAARWRGDVDEPYDPVVVRLVGHWCSGPGGIGTFLIRLFTATGEQRYADLAVQAAAATAQDVWSAAVGACCGLAGDGHFLLDLAERTGDERYRARAEEMAEVIHIERYRRDGLDLPSDPDRGYDYGHGTAGVLDFLLRLRYGGPRPWTADADVGREREQQHRREEEYAVPPRT